MINVVKSRFQSGECHRIDCYNNSADHVVFRTRHFQSQGGAQSSLNESALKFNQI